jgi:hypothetical protein
MLKESSGIVAEGLTRRFSRIEQVVAAVELEVQPARLSYYNLPDKHLRCEVGRRQIARTLSDQNPHFPVGVKCLLKA